MEEDFLNQLTAQLSGQSQKAQWWMLKA
jgi:hypothetical protein